MKCIYCLRNLPKTKFKKREHVIPQCFGKFSPENLILYNTVCDDCNKYFGEKIEFYLGRDAIESILRYDHRIRSQKPFKKHKKFRCEILEKEIHGLLGTLEYSKMTGEALLLPVSQIGFFHKFKNSYVYFYPEKVPSVEVLRKDGYDLKREISIISVDSSGNEDIIRLLQEKGINFISTRKRKLPRALFEKKKVSVKVETRIDHTLMRGISKIAFNYLAFVKGKRYVLQKSFDGLRKFIRYDIGKSLDYFLLRTSSSVQFNKKFIKKFNIKHNNGHILMIQWNGRNLLCTLDLFISNNYMVKYCENCVYKTDPTILSGHFFDTDSKKVHEIKFRRLE